MLQDELRALIEDLQQQLGQVIGDQGQINETLQEAIEVQAQINDQQAISNNEQAAAISVLQMRLPRKISKALILILNQISYNSCIAKV